MDGDEHSFWSNQDEIEARIQHWWTRVVSHVSSILEAHLKYGFHEIEGNLNPSIKDLQIRLSVVESAVTTLRDLGVLEIDEERVALNVLQCIWYIKMLAVALNDKDIGRYQEAIKWLDQQSK